MVIAVRTILAPLLGGVIGYITNDLAIKMLFRPRKAVYIGKFHVPFTPGLIPSQQGRIAQSIGDVVSSQLLNEETLRQTLLSDKTIQNAAAINRLEQPEPAVDPQVVQGLLDMIVEEDPPIPADREEAEPPEPEEEGL